MEATKKNGKKKEAEKDYSSFVVAEVAKAMQNKDEELREYVKTLEARMWYGISSGVLIGLAWIIYELLKL